MDHRDAKLAEHEPVDAPAMVVARRDGTVVDQNLSAQDLLGPGQGKPCWDVFSNLAKAEGLPCKPGCVGQLLKEKLHQAQHNRVSTSGRNFELTCIPLGEIAVCILNPRASIKPNSWEKPTPRELEILRLLAEGETTSGIAARLNLSTSTIRTHVEHLLQKFRVHTRTGLVALGFRLGYLD